MKRLISLLLPEKSISRNAWVYALGTYSSKIISLIIFPIVAVELGFADTGKYDLVIATVAILAPLFSLQVSDAVYLWLTNNDEEQKIIGFTTGTLLISFLSLLVFLVALMLHFFHPIPFLFMGASILVSQMLLTFAMQTLRGKKQVKVYMFSMLLRSLVFTAGELWAVFYSDDKLFYVLLAFVVSNLIALLFCVIGGFKMSLFSLKAVRASNFKIILSYTIPMVFNALAWGMLINVNKYVIQSELGFEMNGVFAMADRLSSPVFFLGILYLFSAQDYFLSKPDFAQNFADFKSLLKKVSLLTFLGMMLLLLGGWLFLPLIFPELTDSLIYLPLLAVVNFTMALSVYLGIPYSYLKRSIPMAITTLLGVVVSIICSFLLVNVMGLFGICLGVLLGSLLTLMLRLNNTRIFFSR